MEEIPCQARHSFHASESGNLGQTLFRGRSNRRSRRHSVNKIKVLFFYPNEFLGPKMTVFSQIIRHLDRSRFEVHLALNSRGAERCPGSERGGSAIVRRWDFGHALRGGYGAALHRSCRPPTQPGFAGCLRQERANRRCGSARPVRHKHAGLRVGPAYGSRPPAALPRRTGSVLRPTGLSGGCSRAPGRSVSRSVQVPGGPSSGQRGARL